MKRAGFEKYLKKSAGVIEDLWEDEIEIDGIAYPCAIGIRRTGGAMGIGNIVEGFLNLRIRASVLPSKPAEGETTFLHDGKTWRVDEVKDTNTEGVWALSCIPASE